MQDKGLSNLTQIFLVTRLLCNLMEDQSQRITPRLQIFAQLNQIYPHV